MNCLELTLYPSLTLTLLERRGNSYVKAFGVRKGADASADPYLSGRWYDPWRYVGEVDSDVEGAVRELLDRYGDCVGISISPGDEGLIFVAAFLTQNTTYHANVLRWTHALFSRSERLDEIAELAPSVGNSYQLRRLPAALRAYLSARPKDRVDLLKIPGVGPKVADLYLLFTGDVSAVPVDKHFMRQASRLGLTGRPPDKNHCARYDCAVCPLQSVCLRARAADKLGRLAGWVQTVLYIVDKGITRWTRQS